MDAVIGYYESQGYVCSPVQPSATAAGYSYRSCQTQDALQLKGNPKPLATEETLSRYEFNKQLEAALDEQIPHRAKAKAIEDASATALRDYRIAQTTATARLEAAVGRGPHAAQASISAKMAAFEQGEGSRAGTAGAPAEVTK